MVEPTIPAGATIAAFIMTVISWYGMLRTGVQLVHDDIESRKSVEEDILNMLVDLEHQETSLVDWKRSWQISSHTPNTVLLQFWGARRLSIIAEKLKRIKSDLDRARTKLGRLAEVRSGDWADMSKSKKVLYSTTFIWTKKKYIQDLIDRWPENMTIIKQQSEAGWLDRRKSLAREIAHTTPYHAQVAHLLVQIAMQNLQDAEALRTCCQTIRDDVSVFLDLDLFNVFAAKTEHQEVEQIAQVFQVGHLKLELLLREAGRQRAELTRVIVESATDTAIPEGRIIDAFRAALFSFSSTPRYISSATTRFCLSKFHRAGNSCSRLHQSFREVLADQDPPHFDATNGQLSKHSSILGDLTIARAAFELAQVCLLFLRTTLVKELCRCSIQCGFPFNMSSATWFHFGLELGDTIHLPPLWRDPVNPESYIHGALQHSWCTTDYQWYGMTKPIRHLGLLLVEFSLGTVVFPETTPNQEGTAPVEKIHILVKAEPGPWKWETVSLRRALNFVKQTFNDSENLEKAVEYCLAGPFPCSPSDNEVETHLRRFYFQVVKPLRDIYDIRLNSGYLSA